MHIQSYLSITDCHSRAAAHVVVLAQVSYVNHDRDSKKAPLNVYGENILEKLYKEEVATLHPTAITLDTGVGSVAVMNDTDLAYFTILDPCNIHHLGP